MGSITHEAIITVCGGDSNRAWVWEARLGLPVTMTLHARTPLPRRALSVPLHWHSLLSPQGQGRGQGPAG